MAAAEVCSEKTAYWSGMEFRDFRGPQTLLADTDAFFAGFGLVGLLRLVETLACVCQDVQVIL